VVEKPNILQSLSGPALKLLKKGKNALTGVERDVFEGRVDFCSDGVNCQGKARSEWDSMKTILYVFAFAWFLIGIGALIGGQHLGMGPSQGGMPSMDAGGVSDTVRTGWLWLWMFLIPSLLAGALGAILGRLDDIREAIDFANEQDIPDDKPPAPEEREERADPYIGDGYLSAHPDMNDSTSRHKSPRL